MGLLGLAADQLDAAGRTQAAAALARGDRGGVGAIEGAGALEGGTDLSYDLVVVDVPRAGDHEVGRVVVLLVEAADAVGGEGVDRVDRAEDRAAEGVSPNMVCANRSCTQSPGSSSVIAISSRMAPRSTSTSSSRMSEPVSMSQTVSMASGRSVSSTRA